MLRNFISDDDGSGTVWCLFWSIIFLILIGVAIDAGNAYRWKMTMQITGDSAALAAAMTKDYQPYYDDYVGGGVTDSDARGKAAAMKIASQMMPTSGEVILPEDIKFGTWNGSKFVEGSGPAALVTVRRIAERGNSVPTFLLKLVGLWEWNINTVSVAERFVSDCDKNGVVTSDKIDFQSNNYYTNKICLHGYNGVEANQNKLYDPEVTVSMFDPENDLTVPGGDTSKNIGLDDALSQNNLQPQIAQNVGNIINDLNDLYSGSALDAEYLPAAVIAGYNNGTSEVISSTPTGQVLTNTNIDEVQFESGNVYNISCNGGNNTIDLKNPEPTAEQGKGKATGNTGPSTIEGAVIVTNCKVSLDSDLTLIDTIVATSNTSNMSVTGSSGVSIGDPDNCKPGGGAQILTSGGMHFAAKMQFHGSQLIAAGPISLAAQIDGISGTAIESTSRVDMASNNTLALCPGEADNAFESRRYRLVY